ncbi:RpiB/LacA/LacB family sugar-phosphate isomerase [Streptomyces sp. RKAG337]|uniref:RpiB/LacA/LacB family sugar-phosphate isomerase n=1 Tax=Streptomyces sp. RKAG337 TaxID=2893404 RepID=UPI002033A67F|nr:RpiB/LacA/LacB family sugar-phosphate isomerase [Streptomyces sp. RKAG337]MCM2426416.1 RpiB/LacA/LacB family sugar-phosphate isomerase [Streptomyces sp. RKAG337]
MRIAVSSDMDEPVARLVVDELRRRGHTVLAFGALRAGDRKGMRRGTELDGGVVAGDGWAWSAEAAAREVAAGRTEQAVVCCWTGTGASIAANKVAGVRAALCGDAYTARGARKWNDANVLALSLRLTSGALLSEILDAWFDAVASGHADVRANIEHVDSIGVADRASGGIADDASDEAHDGAPVGETVR